VRRLLALLPALVLMTVPAPAHAADRVDRVAGALRQSPVFVDPDVSYLVTARQRAALTRQIQRAGVPVYLAVVPLDSEDESAGDADYFTYLLHRRLGKNGIYLVSDQRGGIDWTAYQVPRDATLDSGEVDADASLPRKLYDIIGAFAHAPKAAPSDPPKPRTPDEDPVQKKTGSGELAGQFSKTFFPSVAISTLLLGLLWYLVLTVVRGVRKARGHSPGNLGGRRLRRAAEAELARLARAIGAAEPGNPGYARALEAYDAAKLLYDEEPDPGSRFAIVVLSMEGQDALRAETAEPRPRCVVSPYHGTAGQRVRRRLPGLPDARRPLCDACERPITKIRPLTLEIDGARRPYYQAPGLWEKIKGRTDRLPGRVLEYLGVE
jgi:hypothetical protein